VLKDSGEDEGDTRQGNDCLGDEHPRGEVGCMLPANCFREELATDGDHHVGGHIISENGVAFRGKACAEHLLIR
jgi:hypothetical protein